MDRKLVIDNSNSNTIGFTDVCKDICDTILIRCFCCEKKLGKNYISGVAGWGSIFDGERISFYICDSCILLRKDFISISNPDLINIYLKQGQIENFEFESRDLIANSIKQGKNLDSEKARELFLHLLKIEEQNKCNIWNVNTLVTGLTHLIMKSNNLSFLSIKYMSHFMPEKRRASFYLNITYRCSEKIAQHLHEKFSKYDNCSYRIA